MGEYTGATALRGFRGTDRTAELAGATDGGGGGGKVQGANRGKGRRLQEKTEWRG